MEMFVENSDFNDVQQLMAESINWKVRSAFDSCPAETIDRLMKEKGCHNRVDEVRAMLADVYHDYKYKRADAAETELFNRRLARRIAMAYAVSYRYWDFLDGGYDSLYKHVNR